MSNDDPFDCSMIMLERPKDWQSRDKSDASKAEMKRRAQMLSDGQREPLWRKIDFSLRVISRAILWSKSQAWGVSFSGGGDSYVLSHLIANKIGLKIPHFMYNTRLEYDETVRNVKKRKEELATLGVDLHIEYPEKRPKEVWAEHGVPLFYKHAANAIELWQKGANSKAFNRLPKSVQDAARRLTEAGVRVSGKCCDELKKKPAMKANERLGLMGNFTGMRCEESRLRRMLYIQMGAVYKASKHGYWLAHPLVHWTRKDVDEYMQRNGIEIERPDNGTGRSGCKICLFGCHLRKNGDENSLQRLGRTHPKFHKAVLDDWGYRAACEAAGIPVEPSRQLSLWDD